MFLFLVYLFTGNGNNGKEEVNKKILLFMLFVKSNIKSVEKHGVDTMVGKRKPLIRLEITEETTADLRGRQSVRTTFKLSERSIDALSILASQLGIKQKSLFDHLIQDTQALKVIAKEFDDFSSRMHRIAKTYVVSRKSLESLERVSMQYDTPRDALVEYSIERILPLLAREKE